MTVSLNQPSASLPSLPLSLPLSPAVAPPPPPYPNAAHKPSRHNPHSPHHPYFLLSFSSARLSFLFCVFCTLCSVSFFAAHHPRWLPSSPLSPRISPFFERAHSRNARLRFRLPTLRSLARSCDGPLVYNKPAKTGSTFIQRAIERWAAGERRALYKCGGVGLEVSLRLAECVPRDLPARAVRCAVMTNHLHLDGALSSVLSARLPGFRLVTSTRHPYQRLVSLFLQTRNIAANSTTTDGVDFSHSLAEFLQHEYDPRQMVSAHLADWEPSDEELRQCPVAPRTKQRIANAVARYAVVVDTNLVAESNAILRHFNLFQLPTDRAQHAVNERGSANCTLSPHVLATLKERACFDAAVHHALQMRMASLYELASGRTCFRHARQRLYSCLRRRETKYLRAAGWRYFDDDEHEHEHDDGDVTDDEDEDAGAEFDSARVAESASRPDSVVSAADTLQERFDEGSASAAQGRQGY